MKQSLLIARSDSKPGIKEVTFERELPCGALDEALGALRCSRPWTGIHLTSFLAANALA